MNRQDAQVGGFVDSAPDPSSRDVLTSRATCWSSPASTDTAFSRGERKLDVTVALLGLFGGEVVEGGVPAVPVVVRDEAEDVSAGLLSGVPGSRADLGLQGNPEVAGSNPAPATEEVQVSN